MLRKKSGAALLAAILLAGTTLAVSAAANNQGRAGGFAGQAGGAAILNPEAVIVYEEEPAGVSLPAEVPATPSPDPQPVPEYAVVFDFQDGIIAIDELHSQTRIPHSGTIHVPGGTELELAISIAPEAGNRDAYGLGSWLYRFNHLKATDTNGNIIPTTFCGYKIDDNGEVFIFKLTITCDTQLVVATQRVLTISPDTPEYQYLNYPRNMDNDIVVRTTSATDPQFIYGPAGATRAIVVDRSYGEPGWDELAEKVLSLPLADWVDQNRHAEFSHVFVTKLGGPTGLDYALDKDIEYFDLIWVRFNRDDRTYETVGEPLLNLRLE